MDDKFFRRGFAEAVAGIPQSDEYCSQYIRSKYARTNLKLSYDDWLKKHRTQIIEIRAGYAQGYQIGLECAASAKAERTEQEQGP